MKSTIIILFESIVTLAKEYSFDIGKAIDNDEYMTNHGKQLTEKEKAMLKALFGE